MVWQDGLDRQQAAAADSNDVAIARGRGGDRHSILLWPLSLSFSPSRCRGVAPHTSAQQCSTTTTRVELAVRQQLQQLGDRQQSYNGACGGQTTACCRTVTVATSC